MIFVITLCTTRGKRLDTTKNFTITRFVGCSPPPDVWLTLWAQLGIASTMGRRRPKIVESVPDSEDEEISEDGAFDSEDERQYGEFFNVESKSDDSDSSEDDSSASSDDASSDEGGDGGQYMLELLDQLDSKPKAATQEVESAIVAHVKESPSAVKPKGNLTLDELMDGIKDTKGFGSVQKSMRTFAQPTETPLAKVVSDRVHRKVQYEEQSKEISQWNTAVQINRKAETLDFRPKERLEMTRDVMLAKFVPTTDLEKEIHAALEEAGEAEEASLLQKEDDLGATQMTIEQYRERQNQLAKMRSLMFSYEQKRHQINKIKSKQYRRIRKRQREKQKEFEAEENPEILRELREKEEIERMKERATLAHKNTSKWAKRILKRGKNVDVDTRKALSAQLQRGEDLRKRMQSSAGSDADDDDDEDLIAAATKTLEETESDSADEAAVGKGLFKLKFMQKGVEKQRERAKEEARQLLLELKAANEEQVDSDADNSAPVKPKRKKAPVASADEMKKVLKDGDLVVSSIKFNSGSNVATDGSINIKDFDRGTPPARMQESSSVYEQIEVPQPKAVSEMSKTSSETGGLTKATTVKATVTCGESNPWLPSENSKKSSAKKKSPKGKVPVRGYVDIEKAVDLLDTTPKAGAANTNTESLEQGKQQLETNPAETKITMLSQEELVQKAFAGPSNEELEKEFEEEKDLFRQEEVTKGKKKKRDMSASDGWGSWAGAGVRPKRTRITQEPDKVVPRRKDDKKPTVIISQARIKRTADKYMLSDVPYPFTSRAEYEKSLEGGIGREWNVTSGFKAFTRPEIMTRAGKIIKPISKKMKVKRAPAKF